MVTRSNTRECFWPPSVTRNAFVVEPGGCIRLEHLDAADGGGGPSGVTRPIESFSPALTREQRQAWLEEDTRLSSSVVQTCLFPWSRQDPLCCFYLEMACVSSCSADEAGDVVPSANPFEKTTVLDRLADGRGERPPCVASPTRLAGTASAISGAAAGT